LKIVGLKNMRELSAGNRKEISEIAKSEKDATSPNSMLEKRAHIAHLLWS
jgi:hypothetical protein